MILADVISAVLAAEGSTASVASRGPGICGVGDGLRRPARRSIPDPDLARLLTRAQARACARPVVLREDDLLDVVPATGVPGPPDQTPVDLSRLGPIELVRALTAATAHGGRLYVGDQLTRPASSDHVDAARAHGTPDGSGAAEPSPPSETVREVTRRLTSAERPLILAGHAVLRARAVAALRTVSAVTTCGVLNSWAAKGVLPWHSPYHLGTIGLQDADLALCDLDQYDLVVLTGLDERPAGAPEPDHRQAGDGEIGPLPTGPSVLRLPAADLPHLAALVEPRRGVPSTGSPFRDRLSAVVQAAWNRTAAPLPPTALTRHYAQSLGSTGMVAADAGTAGSLLGRSFSTLRPGSVLLPAEPVAGFAAACVLVRRLAQPGLPALAVTDGDGPDPRTRDVLELAAAWGTPVPVACWTPDGRGPDAHTHRERLFHASRAGAHHLLSTGYDTGQIDELRETAGEFRIW